MSKPMKLGEIAERINAHLKRFEADPTINADRAYTNHRGQVSKLPPFYRAGAFASGRYVGIRYISYQGISHISKADALRYLAMLDDGFVGKHQQAFHGQAA